jgi:hypothetical protein
MLLFDIVNKIVTLQPTKTLDDINKIVELLYFQNNTLISPKLQKELMSNEKIKSNLSKQVLLHLTNHTESNYEENKKTISYNEIQTPLYSRVLNNILLIKSNDVYSKVVNEHFRQLTPELVKQLRQECKQKHSETTLKRYQLMLSFIDNFDLNALQHTYLSLFYYSSYFSGLDLTICLRPSYIPTLDINGPYYTRRELVNLGLNMGLIKEKQGTQRMALDDVCSKIQDNDFKGVNIYQHQQYIQQNKGKYIVRDFSLYGSFYINRYLRSINDPTALFKDVLIEKMIEQLWGLISNAPAFEKSYYVYRFISKDDYLSDLKVGDVWVDNSFTSTTRDPFYDSQNNYFGFKLLKIKLPANKKGCGLMVEPYSHFKNEQEIILPPYAKYKLISVDSEKTYYHINDEDKRKINKIYEFEQVEVSKPKHLMFKYEEPPTMPTWDLNRIEYVEGDTLENRITFLRKTYENKNGYINFKWKSKTYTFRVHLYDALDVYQEFFFLRTKKGVSFFLQNYDTGKIYTIIEINNIMSVNYYHRHNDLDPDTSTENVFLNDPELISLVAHIGGSLMIPKVILHPIYNSCYNLIKHQLEQKLDFENMDKHNREKYMFYMSADLFNYSVDLLNYVKHKQKRFDEQTKQYLLPQFYYFQLDKLDKIKCNDWVDINNKLYRVMIESKLKNGTLRELYLIIVTQYFYLLPHFNDLMAKVFNPDANPFLVPYYILDVFEYLVFNGQIGSYTSIKEETSHLYSQYMSASDVIIEKVKTQRNKAVSEIIIE